MARRKTIEPYLERLQKFGSSIELTWGEEDGLWALAWISGGKRYTAHEEFVDIACVVVLNAAARDNYLAQQEKGR